MINVHDPHSPPAFHLVRQQRPFFRRVHDAFEGDIAPVGVRLHAGKVHEYGVGHVSLQMLLDGRRSFERADAYQRDQSDAA